jgi:hypothetical protein
MNIPIEFDEKKFWMALFSIMAQREAANLNATAHPFVAFCGEWPIPNRYRKEENSTR